MAEQPNLNRLFQTAGQQKQQAGTGYTNLNRLFQANQGNQLGQKVAGNIQKQVGNVQSQLGQQQQEFQTESEKNKLGSAEDITKRDEVIGRFAPSSSNPVDNSANPKQGAADFVGSGRSGGLLEQSGVSKPQQTVSDEDVATFGRFTNAQYAGPQGLRDTGALQNTASQLKGQVSNFSPSGTQELLRRSVGGDRYTQGQQRLDALLMDKSALTPVARQATALGQNINRANLAASGQAELNKNLAQRFGEETQSKLTEGMTGIDTSVQGQLAAAQAVEKNRAGSLASIQNFVANKTPKLDASGNPVLDQYGNPTFDTTTKTRGEGDRYAQTEHLKNLLASQGAQTGELNQIFGTGNIREMGAAFDAQKAAGTRQQAALDAVAAAFQNTVNMRGEAYSYQQRALKDYQAAQRHAASFSGTPTPTMDANKTLGFAGQALQGDDQENLYKSLATSLGNSQAATGLTQEGVASDKQRANYEALNRLMGKTSSESKYRTNDPTKYEAGKLLLNPDQIKRSLGY